MGRLLADYSRFFNPQVVDTHRDVERKAMLQMQIIFPATESATVAKDSSVRGGSLHPGNISHPSPSSAAVAAAQQQNRQLLLSLTVDGVNVHSMPNARLRCQVCQLLEHSKSRHTLHELFSFPHERHIFIRNSLGLILNMHTPAQS